MSADLFEEEYEEYLKLNKTNQDSEIGIPLCECFCVSGKDLLGFIQTNGPHDYQQLAEHFKFGSGCGKCAFAMESWLKKIN